MDILSAIFYIATTTGLLVLALVSALVIRIFVGKSIRNPDYPPVVGTVFDQLFYFNRLYDYQIGMSKKHRTSRLLAPDQSEIYTTDPRNIEYILKTNFHNYCKGQYNQDIMTDLFGQGIFVVDGDKWRQQKKLASFEFSTRVLRDFSCSVFRKKSAKLVHTIQQFSKHNLVFDVQALLMRCTLDSIFTVGFGVDLNSLEESNAQGNEFIKAFDDSNELVYWRYVDPLWKLKRYLNVGGEATLKKNVKFIHKFVDRVIRTKREQMEKEQNDNVKKDLLSRFLVESKKDPETMNNQYLRDIILSFMVAGKDTTANTLSWFIYMLCKNPLIQEKIAQQVRKVCSNNERTVSDFVENITDEALEEMHYLHATLTETLRLYPAVPVDGRCAETDDTLPDGYRLKRGDGVYYMAYAMGRMTDIWGDDAEEFKPERWLKNGVFQPESPFKFVAFNAGPRTCLGKDFAYRQMKIVSAALLRFFRFRLSDDTKNVTYRTMLTLHISGSLDVLAVPRIGLLEI
ncbi:cytochrome P450 [Perilla frutescens var. frutescens]|nr:cytochrome P450 [Perilla frutescens var. frutescens]